MYSLVQVVFFFIPLGFSGHLLKGHCFQKFSEVYTRQFKPAIDSSLGCIISDRKQRQAGKKQSAQTLVLYIIFAGIQTVAICYQTLGITLK